MCEEEGRDVRSEETQPGIPEGMPQLASLASTGRPDGEWDKTIPHHQPAGGVAESSDALDEESLLAETAEEWRAEPFQ